MQTFQTFNTISSSIIDGANKDLKKVFGEIVTYFDPNKSQNKKTKVLDCSITHIWSEDDYKQKYQITKTRNFNGLKNNTFDVVIFEPPIDKNFSVISTEYAGVFYKLIEDNGVVIVKVKDFKEDKELKGSYNIQTIFNSCNFYLNNKIIYKYKDTYNNLCQQNKKDSNINYCYFLIFFKKDNKNDS